MHIYILISHLSLESVSFHQWLNIPFPFLLPYRHQSIKIICQCPHIASSLPGYSSPTPISLDILRSETQSQLFVFIVYFLSLFVFIVYFIIYFFLFLFFICQRSEIIQFFSFSVWPLSLDMISSSYPMLSK